MPSSRTPSISPRSTLTNQFPAITQSDGPAPPVPSFFGAHAVPNLLPMQLAATQKATCLTMGCNSTRIRRDCNRRMCKAHCLESGGCTDPAHKRTQPTAIPYEAPAQPIEVPAPLLPIITPPAENLKLVGARPPNSSNSIYPTKILKAPVLQPTHTEPTFSSHITQVFTMQMALEEQMREISRQREATWRESKLKVQQTVIVYAWVEVSLLASRNHFYSYSLQDDVAPVPFEVQEGFVWPHFILNEAILSLAGFTHISAQKPFNVFRFNLGHWTTVRVNHVIEVKGTPRVFIKATHVKRCLDFKILLASTSSSATSPNIRTNLAAERAYIKKKMVDHELSHLSTTLFLKNKRNLSPDSPPTTPSKRQRFLSEEVLPVTPTQDCNPIPSPCEPNSEATPTAVQPERNVLDWEREPIELYDSDTSADFLDPSPIPPSMSSQAQSATNLLSTSTAPSTTPSTRVNSSRPNLTTPFLSSTLKTPKWPADFFAVDVAKCFDEVEDNAGEARVRSIFERHFGQWVSYKRSTFYEHRQRWAKASLEVKQTMLSAGRTKAGCWIIFMSTTPAPRARTKAARKRGVINEDLIEILSEPELE